MKTFKNWLTFVDTRARGRSTSLVLGLLTASFLLPGLSWAGDDYREPPEPGQEQSQHQGQGQAQGQHQGQETTVITEASIAEGAVQVNNVREAQGDYKVDFRNNPNVYAPAIQPTIPCYKTGGGGASGGGIGVSFGGGKIDSNCVEREEIRLGHALGHPEIALFRFCNLENNVAIFGSVQACLVYDSRPASSEYSLLLTEKNRLERELRETHELMVQRCAAAEERGDRIEEDWLECLAK